MNKHSFSRVKSQLEIMSLFSFGINRDNQECTQITWEHDEGGLTTSPASQSVCPGTGYICVEKGLPLSSSHAWASSGPDWRGNSGDICPWNWWQVKYTFNKFMKKQRLSCSCHWQCSTHQHSNAKSYDALCMPRPTTPRAGLVERSTHSLKNASQIYIFQYRFFF